MAGFHKNLEDFVENINALNKNSNIPKWFKPFINSFKTFSIDLTQYVSELEGRLAIQKTVTDTLTVDRDNIQKKIGLLEDEIDSLQQYSRRTCLLVHGVKETKDENTDNVVMDVIESKLNVELSQNDIGRTHRLGRKTNGEKPRPLIVRFATYRPRKKVFDSKRKLKGQGIVITENLTKKRYSLLQKCIVEFGRDKVWSFDGRITCITSFGKKVFERIEDLSSFLAQ